MLHCLTAEEEQALGRDWYWHQNFFIDAPPNHMMDRHPHRVEKPLQFGKDEDYQGMQSLWLKREASLAEPSIWKTPYYPSEVNHS